MALRLNMFESDYARAARLDPQVLVKLGSYIEFVLTLDSRDSKYTVVVTK